MSSAAFLQVGDTVGVFFREPPSANRWWRNVNGRMVTSKAAREYKDALATQCLVMRVQKIAVPTPISVRLVWFRGRKSGDLDKRIGVALDGLQGIWFDNDSQIVELNAKRVDDGTGRIYIEVRAA